MRNIFDQYTQPENRLTHGLATVLHEDPALLRSFLKAFGPKSAPPAGQLSVIEQSLPGRPEYPEGKKEARGLPDALIFSEKRSWALVIESKVNHALTKDQLRRHTRTVQKCGFEEIAGLAITVRRPSFEVEGWRLLTWKDIYCWAVAQQGAPWARTLVDYFNVAEAKMAAQEYLKEGTITEFSGISFDPYSYLEGKRVLRLLAGKIREDKRFIRQMRLDASSGRSAITEQERLWDFVSFVPPGGKELGFSEYPHCTVGVGPDDADAMVTFPHGMRPALRQALHGESFDEFAARLAETTSAITKSLKGLKAYRPVVRVQQRRYKSQRSVPVRDGFVSFDPRTISGGKDPVLKQDIKRQEQWARAAYELLVNKRSNIQFQIGVSFDHVKSNELANKNADAHFKAVFAAVRPFAAPVLAVR